MSSRSLVFYALISLMAVAALGLVALTVLNLLGDKDAPPRTGTDRAAATQPPTALTFSTRTPVPTLVPFTDTPTATSTETPTATPTITLTPTATNTHRPQPPPPTRTNTPVPPTATPPSKHGLSAQLTMCPKPPQADGLLHYFAENERVCFVETLNNNTADNVTYSILGINVNNLSGGPSAFRNSWQGDLSICGFCTGPANGPWEDGVYLPAPGKYILSLSLCYSSIEVCQTAEGEWETLAWGPIIVADPAP